MKDKRLFVFAVIGVIAVTAIILIFSLSIYGKKPFNALAASDIVNASVRLIPPDVTIQLNENEIGELADILKDTVIYQKDDSYTEYNGQAVIYTIKKIDGETIKVMAYNPFLIIDDTGYKTKYEPCEALNAFGNRLNKK